MLKIAAYGVAVCVALYGLHRLALWMERRGWIFYWHTQSTTGAASAALGSTLQELNALAQPEVRHVIEE